MEFVRNKWLTLASSNGPGWFPQVTKNIASSNSRGSPLRVSFGIGIGASVIVTISLGVLLYMMEKREKKRNREQNKPKEALGQWHQLDETPSYQRDEIPSLVIE